MPSGIHATKVNQPMPHGPSPTRGYGKSGVYGGSKTRVGLRAKAKRKTKAG
jgi:hypothetical protein